MASRLREVLLAADFSPKLIGAELDMQAQIEQFESQLSAIDERLVLLQSDQAGELLAGLIACWRKDKVPLLGAREEQAIENTAAYSPLRPLTGSVPGMSADTALVCRTSGSSGKALDVAKSFAQLDAEIDQLQSLWGERLADTITVSMVPRWHMFGLPFALLWPAREGRKLLDRQIRFHEQLETLAASQAELALCCSPAQLDHIPGNVQLKQPLRQIFCAGAPLATGSAEQAERSLGPVTEIYGSTETGAIAWREPLRETLWQCLPQTRVHKAGETQCAIESPPGSAEPVILADQLELHSDGRFRLLGRSDAIIKVAGKRYSTTAIEQALNALDDVRISHCLQLPERKQRIGAVVVLSGSGKAALIDRGKQNFVKSLKEKLSKDLDRLALPRYWRFVNALPENAMGKVEKRALQALFDANDMRSDADIVQVEQSDQTVEITLFLPHQLYWFEGHFPGSPILPGVVQIRWAEQFAQQYFGVEGAAGALRKLKFQHILQPGQQVNLTLDRQGENEVRFVYRSGGVQHASGVMAFR